MTINKTQMQARIQVAINEIFKGYGLPRDGSLSLQMSHAAMARYEAAHMTPLPGLTMGETLEYRDLSQYYPFELMPEQKGRLRELTGKVKVAG